VFSDRIHSRDLVKEQQALSSPEMEVLCRQRHYATSAGNQIWCANEKGKFLVLEDNARILGAVSYVSEPGI